MQKKRVKIARNEPISYSGGQFGANRGGFRQKSGGFGALGPGHTVLLFIENEKTEVKS